jgi:hypothetical protein
MKLSYPPPAFSIAHLLGRPKKAQAATKEPLRLQAPPNRSGGKAVANGKSTRTANGKPAASPFAHLRPAPAPTEDDLARARAAAVIAAAEVARTPTSARPPTDPVAAAVIAAGRKRRGEA